MSKKETFLKQIDEKISRFEQESSKHKKLHRKFRYSVFFLAAFTSILSGLALSYSDFQVQLNFAILVIGAVSGVVTSLEGMRRPFDLWIMERNVYYSLLDLKEDYEYQSSDNDEDITDDYHRQMQELLNASKEKWTKKLKVEEKGAKNANK